MALVWSATVGTGLVVGLFAGWAVSAVPGLAETDDRTYVDAMRAINRAILNPWFLIPFVGTLVALAGASIASLLSDDQSTAVLLLAATGVYGIGVFGVTVVGNVPLNDRLAEAPLDDATSYASARRAYERPWNRLHMIRSVLGVVAFALTVTATLGGSS